MSIKIHSPSYQSCFDFTKLFQKLKCIEKSEKSQKYQSISTNQKGRPKSMCIPRIKTLQDSNIPTRTMYSTKFHNTPTAKQQRSAKSTKVRFFTQQSASNQNNFQFQSMNSGVRYMPINHSCLRKIHFQKSRVNSQLIERDLSRQRSILRVNELKMNVNNANNETKYKKSLLISCKKKRKVYQIVRSSDISATIQGHKIF